MLFFFSIIFFSHIDNDELCWVIFLVHVFEYIFLKKNYWILGKCLKAKGKGLLCKSVFYAEKFRAVLYWNLKWKLLTNKVKEMVIVLVYLRGKSCFLDG